MKTIPLFFALLLFAMGCTTSIPVADLPGLYNQAARYHGPERNPVIVIPGILGSKLLDKDTGQSVWGAFGGDTADVGKPMGARLTALEMRPGIPLRELQDMVIPNGALDRVHIKLLGLPVQLKAYAQILGVLGAGGYRDQQLAEAGAVDYGDDHFTCFQFSYDWRRDNVENAQQLHAFIEAKRAFVARQYQEQFGVANPDVKFDIVAHSMGGLIARYFLRYGDADLPADGGPPRVTWAGARHVDKVVIVGTPSAGSANGFTSLIEGISFGPFFSRYEPALLGTMPSVYQLMPRARHGAYVLEDDPDTRVEDIFDPARWEAMEWGLMDPAQDRVLQVLLPEVSSRKERLAVARDHLAKCLARAVQFHAALDLPAERPAGLDMRLFAGDAIATPAVLKVGKKNKAAVHAYAPGDGTVIRTSALMDERVGKTWSPALVTPVNWSNVTFLFQDHLGLTRDPVFADNVLFYLLEQQ